MDPVLCVSAWDGHSESNSSCITLQRCFDKICFNFFLSSVAYQIAQQASFFSKFSRYVFVVVTLKTAIPELGILSCILSARLAKGSFLAGDRALCD